MPFATINGIRIHYLVQGKGPHLLMFAPGGWRSVISRWTAAGGKEAFGQMDGLTTLSLASTCIAYDRRECGQSGGRVEPLDWDLYVQEAKALLDLAGAKQVYVLGSCMGASLALAFAVRHPANCTGLLLHWPVGGYLWMKKGHEFFKRHIGFVRAKGLAAVVERAPRGENFWLDPEIGPWARPPRSIPSSRASSSGGTWIAISISARKAGTRSSTTPCLRARAARTSCRFGFRRSSCQERTAGTPCRRPGRSRN